MNGVNRPFRFDVTWYQDLREFLDPCGSSFFKAEMYGEVDVNGMTDSHKAIIHSGYIDLRYREGKIEYYFEFDDKSGRMMRFAGWKTNIKPWNLPWSHTNVTGVIYGDDDIVKSVVEAKFRLRDIPKFVKSLRVR